jgi:hypothetical protein
MKIHRGMIVSPGIAALSHSFHLSRSTAWISDNCATVWEMLHPNASAPFAEAYTAVPPRATLKFTRAQVLAATRRSEGRYRPFRALGFRWGFTWASSPSFNRAGFQPSHFRHNNRLEHVLGVDVDATVQPSCWKLRVPELKPSCHSHVLRLVFDTAAIRGCVQMRPSVFQPIPLSSPGACMEQSLMDSPKRSNRTSTQPDYES